MVNLKRLRAKGQLKGNLLQFTQHCLKAWPQILGLLKVPPSTMRVIYPLQKAQPDFTGKKC